MGNGRSIIKRASVLVVFALAFSGLAPIAQASDGPSIRSDKEDYPPASHVVLTGDGWQSGETVNIDVNDSEGSSWRRNVDVVADDAGAVRDEFDLPDWFVATYAVTATGSVSGAAHTTFTDANLRFISSGPSFSASWTRHTGLDCTGAQTGLPSSGSGTVTANDSSTLTLNVGANANQSVKLTAPATAGGQSFVNWTSSSGGVINNTTDGGRTVCAQGDASASVRRFTANYATIVATTLTASPASGTYGGTVNLSATLTAGGSPVSGKPINFSLNGSPAGSASTDGSGVATLSGASLGSINAGTYPTGVGATFAGDSGHTSSSDTDTLTVGQAATTTTVSCEAGPFPYTGSAYTPCTASVSGPGLSESLTVSYTDNVNAGTVTASASYPGTANYAGSGDSEQFTIDQVASVVTVTCADGPHTYTGSAHDVCTATVTFAEGSTDDLVVSYDDNINAGTVTASASYSGDANHTGDDDTEQFTIGQAASVVTVTCEDGPFTYTGSAHDVCTATVTFADGSTDDLVVSYDDNVNAGTVTASASYAGDDNHTGDDGSDSFDIDPAELTVTFSAAGKTYDDTDTAEITTCSVAGVIDPDDVGCDPDAATATFSDQHAGTNKTVTGSGFVLDGADAGNYVIATVNTTTADIDPAELTIAAVSDSKVYDGDTSSSQTPSVSGLQGDDTVTDEAQAFQSEDVLGTGGSTLVVTGYTVNDGNDGDNYTVSTPTATGTITPKPLTITGAEANDKVYDTTTTATVDFSGASLDGVVDGDDVTIDSSGYSAEFNTAAVGTDKPVTVTGVTLGGADAGNYTVSQPTGLTADILAWDAQGRGFYSPVGVSSSVFVAAPGAPPSVSSSTIWNSIKGGQTVPLKFNVFAGTVEQTSTSAVTSFTAVKVSCLATSTTEDAVDFTTSGGTTLRYDTTDGQFIQNWKTPTGSFCYRATATFLDGSSLSAFFKTKK